MTLERLTKITSIGISSGIQITNPVFAGVVTATKFNTENINATGVSTLGNTVVGGGTTQLIVTGNARITGILTIGTSSVTLDGTNNQVNVGTGVTIHHTNGVQVGVNTLHSTGLTINQINVGTGASISSPATNILALGTNNVERIRVDSSGNVGIGSISASAKLHIRTESGTDTAGSSNSHILFDLADDGGPGWAQRLWDSGAGSIGLDGSFALDRRSSGTWTNVLTAKRDTGNLGIGTTNPTSLLTVKNGTNTGFSDAQIKLGDSTNDVGMQISQASDNVGAPRLVFAKSRGTLNSPTTVQTDDQIFSMRGSGYVGSTGGWATSGLFGLFVDGPVSNTSNGLGTRFSIWTKPNGGSENLERVRVSAAGTMTLRASGGAFIEGYNGDDNQLDIAKLSRMGYDTGYRNLVIGNHLPNSTSYTYQSLSLNYDPNTNSGSSFNGNGNEIFVPNNNQSVGAYTRIMQPNVANNNFNELIRFGDNGQVLTPNQCFVAGGAAGGSISGNNNHVWATTGRVWSNIGNNWNASTGTFTAPVDGVYHVSAAIRYSGVPSTPSYVYIYFLASYQVASGNPLLLWSPQTESGGTYRPRCLTALMYCRAGDTIQPRLYVSGGTISLDEGSTGQSDTFLNIYLLG